MTRRVHSPEGRALTLDGAHEAGRVDAVRTVAESRRHPPVLATRLPQPTAAQEREAERVWREHMASTSYRIERVRTVSLCLSLTMADLLRGDATEADVRAAEDDVIRAIAARRRAL